MLGRGDVELEGGNWNWLKESVLLGESLEALVLCISSSLWWRLLG